MRITSIDIETTGLDPKKCQTLQIGAVVFDTTSEVFESIATYNKVIRHSEIHGEPFAIQMNACIIKQICDYSDLNKQLVRLSEYRNTVEYQTKTEEEKKEFENVYLDKLYYLNSNSILPESVSVDFKCFIRQYGSYVDEKGKSHANVTGKNFWIFDYNFLKELPGWDIYFHRRSFDPASLYFRQEDKVLPSLQECKKRCMEEIKDTQYEYLFSSDTVTHDALDDAMDVAKLVWYRVRSLLH